MNEKRRFLFEFDNPEDSGFRVSAPEGAALRLGKGNDNSFSLLGNQEGLLALARALVLLAQPEAGRVGANLRVEHLTEAGREGLAIEIRRNDRVSEWPGRGGERNMRVTDILREQGLVREDDPFALLLKSVGERPLAVYTVLRKKLGMPSEEVVRIGDNAPLVVKTYRDLPSAQSDAEDIADAGGVAIPAHFVRS